MKRYQKFFNKKLGYRKDYKASFWYYLKQFQIKYFIYWYKFSNEDKSYKSYSITFFNYTIFAFKFQLNIHNGIYFSSKISFSILKPNLQLVLKFNRNTA